MMRRSRSLPSWVGVALTLFFSLSAAPIARAADGWATLWSQNCAAAKPLFQKAASGAGAADARRGLGLIAQCEDAPGTAAEQWRTIYAVAPDSWQAAAYWQEFADAARDSGKEPVLIDAARAILARKSAPSSAYLRARAQVALAETLYKICRPGDAEKRLERSPR